MIRLAGILAMLFAAFGNAAYSQPGEYTVLECNIQLRGARDPDSVGDYMQWFAIREGDWRETRTLGSWSENQCASNRECRITPEQFALINVFYPREPVELHRIKRDTGHYTAHLRPPRHEYIFFYAEGACRQSDVAPPTH
jgi:hypothetical protein